MFSDLHVLLIDDNKLDNFIHRKVLERLPSVKKIHEYNDAREALDFLKNSEALFPVVIFLDLRMPGHDGFYFLREFQELPESVKQQARVLILSSSVDEHDMEEVKKSGLETRFLTKPLTLELAENVLRSTEAS